MFLTTKNTKKAQSSQKQMCKLQRFVLFVNPLCVPCGKIKFLSIAI